MQKATKHQAQVHVGSNDLLCIHKALIHLSPVSATTTSGNHRLPTYPFVVNNSAVNLSGTPIETSSSLPPVPDALPTQSCLPRVYQPQMMWIALWPKPWMMILPKSRWTRVHLSPSSMAHHPLTATNHVSFPCTNVLCSRPLHNIPFHNCTNLLQDLVYSLYITICIVLVSFITEVEKGL